MSLASLLALTCVSQVFRGAETLKVIVKVPMEVAERLEVTVRVPMGIAAHRAIIVAALIVPIVLGLKESSRRIRRKRKKEEGVGLGERTNIMELGRRRRNRVSTILALILTNVKNVWDDIPVLSVFATRFFTTNLAIFVRITGGTFFTLPAYADSLRVDTSLQAQRNHLFLLTERKMMETTKKSTFIDNQNPLLIYWILIADYQILMWLSITTLNLVTFQTDINSRQKN